MPIYLKQSTASQEIPLGPFLSTSDGDTNMTALTIANTDIKIWKNGATTLASKNSGGGTHISVGIYYAVLDATDTDTLGPLMVFVHVATALAIKVECVVLAAVVFDSLIGGGDLLQVDSTQQGGTALTARDIGASVLLSSGTGTGQLSLSSGKALIQTNTKVNQALAAFPFVMTDSSGNAVLGATVTATRSIDGGAFAACTNAVSEVGNGWYKISLSAADMNGTTIALRFTATGARDTDQVIINLP